MDLRDPLTADELAGEVYESQVWTTPSVRRKGD